MPRRTLLLLSLLLNVAFILFFIGKRVYWTYFRTPARYVYNVDDYMNAVAEIQGSLTVDTNSIVFVGNSLTSNFPLNELFPDLPVKNRGVGNNQLTHILGRITGIAECRPRMILLEGGINDIAAGRTLDSCLLLYTQIIHTVKQISPRTTLIIQSTLPVSGTSVGLMPVVDEFNSMIKELAGRVELQYVDVGSLLRKDGKLDNNLTWDGIHLNSKGYKLWADKIRPVILSN